MTHQERTRERERDANKHRIDRKSLGKHLNKLKKICIIMQNSVYEKRCILYGKFTRSRTHITCKLEKNNRKWTACNEMK